MDVRVQDEVFARLARLEREMPRLRKGVVTGTGPLDVELGGSGVSIEGVPAIGGPFVVDDVVSVVAQGNQVLVLGPRGDGSSGWETVSYASNWRRLSNDASFEVQVRRTASGLCLVRGIIERVTSNSGTLPQTMCTLPAGHRPDRTVYFHTRVQTTDAYSMTVRVDATGAVRADAYIEPANGTVVATNSFVYLDGLVFSV